jgi:hypothetical protein
MRCVHRAMPGRCIALSILKRRNCPTRDHSKYTDEPRRTPDNPDFTQRRKININFCFLTGCAHIRRIQYNQIGVKWETVYTTYNRGIAKEDIC